MTKSRKQRRAEAVERLRKYGNRCKCVAGYTNLIFGLRDFDAPPPDLLEQLIDLLSEDEADNNNEMRSSTDEERALYEDMLARKSTPIDVDIFEHDADTCEGPSKVLVGPSGLQVGNITLNADGLSINGVRIPHDGTVDEIYDALSAAQERTITEHYGADGGHIADMSENDGDLVRQVRETSDTREKLEADVREWCAAAVYPESRERQIGEWLDRQAAITHRERDMEWSLNCDGMQKLLDERARENDELRAKLRECESDYETLWDERAELVEQFEELKRKLDNCVELPVDADGVPIRAGDKVEGPNGESADANYLTIHEDGAWDIGTRGWVPSWLHHHKQTVADMLSEFAYAYDDIGGAENEDEAWAKLLDEYVDKLQLREDTQCS